MGEVSSSARSHALEGETPARIGPLFSSVFMRFCPHPQ
jgi:hypothetical protein